jgi:hypothetical protein
MTQGATDAPAQAERQTGRSRAWPLDQPLAQAWRLGLTRIVQNSLG